MVFNVTENLCYYIVQLVFKIKKVFVANGSPVGVHGSLGYTPQLVVSSTPVVHSGFRIAIRGTSAVSEC